MAERVTKSEGDAGDFPASDYAYVPEPDKPSTWKLRLTATPGGPPDTRIVGMAIAALGPGFRGNKVQIPEADLPAVKAKVRAAWRKANPDAGADEMPEAIKGSEGDVAGLTKEFLDHLYAQLREAFTDGTLTREEFDAAMRKARSHAGGTAAAAKRKQAAEEQQAGVMIGLWVPEAAATMLAVPDGEPVQELHVTLGYFGATDTLDDMTIAKLMVSAENVARWQAPIAAKVSGVGRFTGEEADAFYASVDSPELASLRDSLCRYLMDYGIAPNAEHGFTPHITLAYLNPEDPSPVETLQPMDIRFNGLTVAIGGKRTTIPFLGGVYDAPYRVFNEFAFAEPPDWIPYLPKPGTYNHPTYGQMEFSKDRNGNFVSNFKDAVYQDRIPIDAEHETKLSGAYAWVTDMRVNDDGSVDARVDWTDRGKTAVQSDAFKYFSPEFYDEWSDPATGKTYRDVAVGGALTTRPFFKASALRPLVASERGF